MIGTVTDQPFRAVTIGDTSVGKTSITNRLIDDTFNKFEPSTIGANYQPYISVVNNQKVEIQIWDTAGQEKFKSLAPIYFRNASAAVAVFSLTSHSSFEGIDRWITNFIETAGQSAIVYVAANKSDCIDEIEVSVEEARNYAQERGYKFFVTSAKTGENIKEMFESLAFDLQKTKEKKESLEKAAISPKKDKGNCC